MHELVQSEHVGLVLAGGGAKGAFQAGVWKAMWELGIAQRVKVISGTSVGAINGAALAVLGEPDMVRDIWLKHIEEVVSLNFSLLDLGKLASAVLNAVGGQPFPFLGIFNRDGLVKLLRRVVSKRIDETGVDVYATALACRGNIGRTFDSSAYALMRFRLNDDSSSERALLKILASASIPWGFDPVEIDGVRYVDGAFEANGGDNVPIAPILDNHPEIKTIYVIHCNSRQISPDSDVAGKAKGRRVVEIHPRQTLPGILDDFNLTDSAAFKSWSGVLSFQAKFARHYFEVGYADGRAALYNPILDAKLEW